MYTLVLILGLVFGAALAVQGLRSDRRALLGAGLGLTVGTAVLFASMSFASDLLWFSALDAAPRFWTFLVAQVVTMAGAAGVASGIVALLTAPIHQRPVRYGTLAMGALAGASWGSIVWQPLLLLVHARPTGIVDPILGLDVSFYLFGLPVIDGVFWLLVLLTVLAAVGALASVAASATRNPQTPDLRPLRLVGVALAGLLALGQLRGIPHLLLSERGVVVGPGWTDVHVALPAHLIVGACMLGLGVLPLVPAWRRAAARWTRRPWPPQFDVVREPLAGTASSFALLGGIWALAFAVVRPAVQWLVVEPNEVTYERPYIEHNIAATRRAFDLHETEERRYRAAEELDPAVFEEHARLLDEVRLWDWRALELVYRQFQEIRLYYEFEDVDIDRYDVNGDRRQVMVAARELEQANLSERSQTFVNRLFKYTHGYGVTLAPVSEFTPEGLPDLLVRDVPPVSTVESLEVTRPEIYYGESTTGPVVVNTEEPEFDYPSGEQNVYTRYSGRGGVEVTNLWRRLVFGWTVGGTQLLLSGYPTDDSRVMFRREIRERVKELAPFLVLDEDPYIVLDEGRLYWIIDAYTTSSSYPYSESFSGRELLATDGRDVTRRVDGTPARFVGDNYVRNSVKVVVDAFDGEVDLYVFEPDDPLVAAWRAALPGLFADRDEMPEGLEQHVRYPVGMLLTQGLVHARYHMTDPEVFYNQEDLWVRATEKYRGSVQPVEPYYVMWEPPGSDDIEFVLMLPFTPKNRQVMIGWIAGLCDPDRYGDFLVYKFPKERRVLGPQQVETKIDQDPVLSARLTLWDQRGSRVIRGNVLAIPLGDTLLYIEPIYLQADTAAYPELRLVVAMHGDQMGYGESLDAALASLVGERAPEEALPGTRPGRPRPGLGATREAFGTFLDAMGARDFEDAADALADLQEALGASR